METQNLFESLELVKERGLSVIPEVSSIQYNGIDSPILLAQDSSGGCGGMIWKAADVLIEYFIWKKGLVQNLMKDKTAVDIGSGTGLVGLAIAKVFPEVKKILLTDQISMMELMQQNIGLNKLDHLVSANLLNWGEKIPEESELLTADVILASECVYLEVCFIPLIETFLALSKKDTIIYLAYRKRRKADKRFFQLARKKFEIEDVMDDPNREIYNKEGIRLFVLKRK
ncbi:putative methyltransferase-domain-containing protein [Sporodiniella umbellata]|nr:putative methyltransferase-domain-containing protein [Sporodiniella umbellata]